MTESHDEPTDGIGDEQLPDDLVPGDDNPLAEPLSDGESAGDLLHEGKPADETDDSAETEDPDDGSAATSGTSQPD